MFTPFHRGGSGPPLLLLHGFTDTWRTWELALESLERHHNVFAPALAGHAGGPPIDELSDTFLVEAIERAMDEQGIEVADVAGNSLGGFVALQLAARGRARSVVALAPAGGFTGDDEAVGQMLDYFTRMLELVTVAAPHADAILASPEGRRRATQFITTHYEHIPAELLAHQMLGVAACQAAPAMIEFARAEGWTLDADRVACPVRIVWGTADRILPWPSAAVRFREEWLPNADWVELDGIGHCPQLDTPLEAAALIHGFATSV